MIIVLIHWKIKPERRWLMSSWSFGERKQSLITDEVSLGNS